MIGNVVGSYKIVEKIGEGGMGAVFKGIDLMLEREVAIKMLRPELASQPQVVERFRSEAVTLAKLNHPNVATLFSFLRQGEDFFMVMEFVRGETLDSLIRRSGAMPCHDAISLFCQALEGIDHAHKMGIVHRDIKPANMMLTETGTLKVMDFGIARVLGTSRMTKQGNIVGTIEYMSPEQVRGQETDARSDIYSLGILLYEMLTGRVPFSSDSEYDLMQMQIERAPEPPRMFSAQIPQIVEQAIMRSLAKRPDARFQGAAEFRNALISAVDRGHSPTVVAPPVSAQQTQIIGAPVAAPPMPGQAAQETRFASDAAVASQAEQIKQTRLASEMNPSFAYGATQPPAGMYQPAPITPAGKSNVKLFIGMAAALFIVMVGAAVVLLVIGKQRAAPPSAPTNQPVQSAAPATPSPAGADQPSIPTQTPPQTNPQVELTKPAGDSLTGATVPVVENANAARGPKSTRKEGSGEAARRESSAEAAARKEKERRAAEARRLLNQ
jgi:tRNA A-37 threonylcarbamoyl transferase component Bud32